VEGVPDLLWRGSQHPHRWVPAAALDPRSPRAPGAARPAPLGTSTGQSCGSPSRTWGRPGTTPCVKAGIPSSAPSSPGLTPSPAGCRHALRPAASPAVPRIHTPY